MTGEQLFGLRRAQNAFLTRKSARIMPGGQDLIPQIALLTHSSRKTTAGSTFIVSPDAKIARIMPGGQDMIPQIAHLTNSPRKTAAGSTFIVSPDAKIARIMSGGQDLIPQTALLTRKSARIMSGGQDSIPQNAHLTNSPRKTAAGSTFIVSPDAKIARIMPGGQDMIPQIALLTHSSRKTAAGSTFIVSPDAKTGPNHAWWARFDTAPGGHVKWPPTAAIFPYFRAQWYFQMTTRRDFPVKVRPVDTYFTRWTSVCYST